MSIDLELFFDKDGDERPPYRWELEERGFSEKQITEILLRYKDHRYSKKPLTMIANFVAISLFILSIIIGLMAWGLNGLCTSYSTPDEVQRCGNIYLILLIIFMPLLVSGCLKWELVHRKWLQNILVGLSFLFGGAVLIYGYWLLYNSNSLGSSFIFVFLILLYGFFIALSTFFILIRRIDYANKPLV